MPRPPRRAGRLMFAPRSGAVRAAKARTSTTWLGVVGLVPTSGAADLRRTLDCQLQARAALALVAELRPRQRELFALQVAGLSYREIAAATGDSVALTNNRC
ncbi:MAG: sigma-70 region 4 domain-containing protein [Actinobacteria bacterium]|nr:sigma-70 region 4 domain-containing protein [Actinomycetota bacterium]